MNILKIAILLVAVIVVWGVARTFLLYQKSQHLVAHSAPFEQTVNDAKQHILVLGDSTAVGTGVSDPQYSVAGRLGSKYPHAHIENWAVNGNKIDDVKKQLQEKPLGEYDLVLLQAGANDIIYHTSRNSAEHDAAEVINMITPHTQHVAWIVSGNIGLAPFFPFPIDRYLSWRTKQFHNSFRAIAEDHGVMFVDLYEPKERDPFIQDPETYYATDLLHLSDKGYGVWFHELMSVLEDRLED